MLELFDFEDDTERSGNVLESLVQVVSRKNLYVEKSPNQASMHHSGILHHRKGFIG